MLLKLCSGAAYPLRHVTPFGFVCLVLDVVRQICLDALSSVEFSPELRVVVPLVSVDLNPVVY